MDDWAQLPSLAVIRQCGSEQRHRGSRASNFIRFPTDQPTLLNNKLAFHRVAGFPNAIAAIDCTHIAIKAPSWNEEAFVNRKGVHTINVQAACDADMKNIVAKWPGSTHDSFVWRNSDCAQLSCTTRSRTQSTV